MIAVYAAPAALLLIAVVVIVVKEGGALLARVLDTVADDTPPGYDPAPADDQPGRGIRVNPGRDPE